MSKWRNAIENASLWALGQTVCRFRGHRRSTSIPDCCTVCCAFEGEDTFSWPQPPSVPFDLGLFG